MLQVVHEVASDAVDAGKAAIDVKEATSELQLPWIELRSTNPAACPVGVVADYHQVDLRPRAPREPPRLWEKDHTKRLEQLRQCLEAVVSGRYEESVERWRYGQRFVGTFHTPHGRETFIHFGGVGYGPLGRTTYLPYAAEG